MNPYLANLPQVVHLSVKNSIYVIRVIGPTNCERTRRHMRLLTTIAEQTQFSHFLLDVRQALYQGSISSLYTLAYHDLEQVGFRRYWKTAILTLPEAEAHRFFEVAAENAGYNIFSFFDESQAVAWLQ